MQVLMRLVNGDNMYYWLYFALFLYTFVSSVFDLNSKKHKLYYYIIPFIIIWLLMNHNVSGDNQMYMISYSQYKTWTFKDPLWGVLIYVGNSVGLDFWSFKQIIIAMSLFILYYALRNKSVNLNYCLFFYSISFIFMDSQVLRNFIVMPWLILASTYLEIPNAKNIIKCIIIIVSCSAIHFSYLFYGVFVFSALRKYFDLKKIVVTGIIINVLLIISARWMPNINIMMDNSDLGIRSNYFESRTSLGFVPVILLYLYMFFCLWYCKKTVVHKMTQNQVLFFDTIYVLDILLASAIPLMLFNIQFYRLIKNFTVINYAVLGNCYTKFDRAGTRAALFVMTILLAIGWFLFENFIYADYYNIVLPVFSGVTE